MTKSMVFKSNFRILIATFLPHLAVCLVMGAVGPLAPFLQEAMGISRAQIGLLTAVHSFGWVVLALVAGGIVERSGIRPWLLLCPALSGLFTMFFLGVSSYFQAVLLFLILGFVFSFVNPATTKAIILGFPRVGRGTFVAIKQTGAPTGIFLASVTLPPIAVSIGWKWGMVFIAAVNIGIGICCWFLYFEKSNGEVIVEKGQNGRNSFTEDLSKLLRNTNFMLISFLQGAIQISQFVINAYLILYLVESLGYSMVYAGFVMALTQVSGIVGRIFCGLMSDFMFGGERVPILKLAGFITVAGLFGMTFISNNTPVWIVCVVTSMVGAASIGFTGTSILLRAELTGKNLAATSTGMGMAIGAWGVILGPPAFGYIVDVTHSYVFAWQLLSVVTLASIVLLWFIREQNSESEIAEETVATEN